MQRNGLEAKLLDEFNWIRNVKWIERLQSYMDMVGEETETRVILGKGELTEEEIIELFKKSELFEELKQCSDKSYENIKDWFDELSDEHKKSLRKKHNEEDLMLEED